MNPAPPGPAPLQYALPPTPRGGLGRGLLGWLVFIGLAVMLFLVLTRNKASPAYTEVPLSEFYRLLREDRVEYIAIEDAEVRGKLSQEMLLPGVTSTKKVLFFRAALPHGMGTNWEFTQWVLENGKSARVEADSGGSLLMNIVVPLIPWLLIFGFIWFLIFRQLRGQAARAQQPMPVYLVNPGAPGAGPTPAAQAPPPSPQQPPGA